MNSNNKIDLNNFLDNRAISSRQWIIACLGALILILDGFDTTMVGFIAPALVEDWSITREALGPFMMSGLVGLSVGALVAGPLADRLGRKTIIAVSVLFFGFWSLMSAFSDGLVSLIVLRFLTGVGLGASMPNTSTLVAEYSPRRWRGLLVTSAYSGFALGGALGGFASEHLIEAFGWRSVFIAGGVLPILLSILLVVLLPESPRFLLIANRSKARLMAAVNAVAPGIANSETYFFSSEIDEGGGVAGLLSSKYRLGTLMLWISMFMGLLLIYLLGSWLPIMVRSTGLSLAQAAKIGAMLQLGGVIGNFTVGLKMDRFDKTLVLAGVMAGCAIFCFFIGKAPVHAGLIAGLVFCLGYFINSSNTGCYALATHFYPTSIRATGVSWTSGIGRLGAIFGAGFGALILGQNWGLQSIFLLLCVAPVIGCLAMLCKFFGERKHSAAV